MPEEKSRRLMQGQDIIYPFTKQENVIGLQKTITDKLPIVSDTTPDDGFVEKQVWLDTEDDGNEQEIYNVSNRNNDIIENNYEIPIQEPNYGDPDDTIEDNYEGEN